MLLSPGIQQSHPIQELSVHAILDYCVQSFGRQIHFGRGHHKEKSAFLKVQAEIASPKRAAEGDYYWKFCWRRRSLGKGGWRWRRLLAAPWIADLKAQQGRLLQHVHNFGPPEALRLRRVLCWGAVFQLAGSRLRQRVKGCW